MKNPSLVARRNVRPAKLQCQNCGRRLNTNTPAKAPKALSKTISSNVMGMLAGRLKSGLPLITSG